MTKNEQKLMVQVCPNCGKPVSSLGSLTSVSSMARSTRGVSPISGLSSCPACNFSGFPIEVKRSELRKIKFKNRKINSLDYKETHDRQIRPVTAIGMLLGVSSLFIGFVIAPFVGAQIAVLSSMLVGFAGAFLAFYGLLKKDVN